MTAFSHTHCRPSAQGKRRGRRRESPARTERSGAASGAGGAAGAETAPPEPEPGSADALLAEAHRRVLFCVDHEEAPNWVSTTAACGGAVVVADPTNALTVYHGVASRLSGAPPGK